MEIYCVGGAVRDELLGIKPKEYDWVVVGSSAKEMLKLGYQQVGKDFPVFLHPETKEEYALARTERKTGDGYYGFECDTSANISLEDDLLRRDLTINAIAKSLKGAIIDPYKGCNDLESQVLRHVSAAFIEDPLRILRVARFASQLPGFTVHRNTTLLMQNMIKTRELLHVSVERVWKEFSKSIMCNAPWRFFEVLDTVAANQLLWPELELSTKSQLNMDTIQFAPDLETRLGLVFWLQDKESSELFAKNYAIPNRCQRLLFVITHLQPVYKELLKTPHGALELMDIADGLRRPDALNVMLNILVALKEHDAVERLNSIISCLSQLKFDEVATKNKHDIKAAIKMFKLDHLSQLYQTQRW